MSPSSLSSDWLNQFSDPFAVLGVSITADDRRVLTRYRRVAKLLHPDSQTSADEATKALASQLLARLVNPAYQKLKQEKGRAENAALVRFKVRRMVREAPLLPRSELACELLQLPVNEVDVFYEQAISKLAETQYSPPTQFEGITQQIIELNLVYSQLKMGETLIREKRTGVVAAVEAKPIQFTPPVSDPPVTENYAQRHYRRAQEYMKKSNWKQAIQELRDAIKIESNKSEYYALLGAAYWCQNLPGMAKVYVNQALKLNPRDHLARQYAAKLGISIIADDVRQNGNPTTNQRKSDNAKGGGLFGFFRSKK